MVILAQSQVRYFIYMIEFNKGEVPWNIVMVPEPLHDITQ